MSANVRICFDCTPQRNEIETWSAAIIIIILFMIYKWIAFTWQPKWIWMWPITFLSNNCKFQSLLLQNAQYLGLCRSRCDFCWSSDGDLCVVDFNDVDDANDDEHDDIDDDSGDDDMFALHLIEIKTHINELLFGGGF